MNSATTQPSAYAAAFALCGVTTLLVTPLLTRVDLTNIVLLFVLTVVVATVRYGRGPGVLAAFSAVACFDFFFVPPRFSLTVEHQQSVITLGVMLGVSLLVGHLTNALRDAAREAGHRATEAELLHALASELGAALTLEEVVARLDSVLARHLNIRATIYLADDPTHVHALEHDGLAIADIERMIANGVFASGQTLHGNADLRDDALTRMLPLRGGTRARGVLALYERKGESHTAPSDGLCSALAAVVATAVERIHFVAVAQTRSLEIQSERLRSSILSALSHDLRTPLTVLYGIADGLAGRDDLPPDGRAAALVLRDQSRHLHSMVDNLLELARLKSGAVALRRDWQSVPELLGACVQSMLPWLDEHSVRLELSADLPLIELDAVLFERVLHNLLENAAKYSTAASVITVSAATSPADLAWLEIAVANLGKGFPPERLAAVFQLFEQAGSESRRSGMGVGLGVCRAIVEAHGGTIAARNIADGCEVRLRLPLRRAPPLPPEADADQQERGLHDE